MSTQRKVPEEHEFDLVVVGGGLAGLCTAVAAARRGARTAIVQERPVFGGNSSTEIRVVPLGTSNFNAWARETGILEELVLEDRATNHVHLFEHGLTNSHWDMVLLEAARREPLLTMFLNTSVRGVDSEPVDPTRPAGSRRVTAVHGSQLGSEKEFVFRARHFVDATGDATVGALAGAEYRYGREARAEFGEPMAPLEADEVTNGSTITMRARNVGRPVPYTPPPWVQVYRTLEEIGPKRMVAHIKRPEYGGYWWLEVGDPYRTVEDNQGIKDELHRHVLGVWNYIKNHSPEKEIASTYALEWIGQVPGKRESRRLVGDAMPTEHDCHNDPDWPDKIGFAGWIIDLHIQGGILNKSEPGEPSHVDAHYRNYIRVPPFSMPLRSFYSRNVENLWMSGRTLSVSRVAFGAVRVQMCLALLGQSVGTAAAYALEHNLSPREVADPAGPHIGRLQQQLLRDDVHVFGVANEDENDLALGARARATSELPLDFGEPDPESFQPLDVARAQVFPVTHDRLETVGVYLRNNLPEPAEVRLELHELDRIWERGPGRAVAEVTLTLPGRFEGWVTAELSAAVTPGKPHRVCLRPAPGVSWVIGGEYPTGTVSQYLHSTEGGAEPQNRHYKTLQPFETDLPKYDLFNQSRFAYALRLEPQPRPYGAGNVNNGFAWPLGMPNLWAADPTKPLPQCVELDFGTARTYNTAVVRFDTHLDAACSMYPDFWRAPTCARHWRLYAKVDGERRLLHEETDNYQRNRVVRFAPVTAQGLELEIVSTNAAIAEEAVDRAAARRAGVQEDEVYPVDVKGPHRRKPRAQYDTARVYEIRVYNE